MWSREFRACVLRHLKLRTKSSPPFMAARQSGSDHPMTRTLLQHGPLDEGCRQARADVLRIRGVHVSGAMQWWSEQSTSATTRWPAPCYRSHLGGRDRTRYYVTGPRETSMVGVSLCSPDLDNQPHRVQTSVSHPTLTEVSKITAACISWLPKHRHVDRGCAFRFTVAVGTT